MTYSVNGTTIVYANTKIDWSKVINTPATPIAGVNTTHVVVGSGDAQHVANVHFIKASNLVQLKYSLYSSACEVCSCLLKGAPILMADNTTKNIEDVVIGDVVQSLIGPTEVIGLKETILGTRRHVMSLNDVLFMSDDHRIWTKNGDYQDWGTYNYGQWLSEKERLEYEADEPFVLTLASQQLAHVEGWKWMKPKYHFEYDENTPLHTLRTKSGSYIAGGFVIVAESKDKPIAADWQGLKG